MSYHGTQKPANDACMTQREQLRRALTYINFRFVRCPQIDIPSWCFSLPDDEYQGCSPAHFAAGSTTACDGRRMSINVEVIGGTPMVQHYVEQVPCRVLR